MNTMESRKHLIADQYTASVFLGIYAIDQLPREEIVTDKWLLVCNCCPVSRRGEHWFAMFYEDGRLEFFDSFGLSPHDYDAVQDFIQRQQAREVYYNDETLQSITSDACGYYCLLLGFLRARGKSMHWIVQEILELDRDCIIKYIVLNFND